MTSDKRSILELTKAIKTLSQRIRNVETRFQSTPSGIVTPGPHAPSHEDGGLDEIDVTGLSGLLADPQTPATHAHAFPLHASSHEDGGGDEISVAGLSGLLADAQTPLAHDTSHEDGGSDEINVGNLSGELADAQKTTIRENSGANVGSRPRLNLIEGDAILHTVTDDAGDNELEIETDVDLVAVWDWIATGLGSITVDDHFHTLNLGVWTWAGSPSFVTPSTAIESGTVLRMSGLSAGTRSFLYQSSSADITKECLVDARTALPNTEVGIRMDDGTDDNYVEQTLYTRGGTAGTLGVTVRSRSRDGGGAPVVQDSDPFLPSASVHLYLTLAGTRWTSWRIRPVMRPWPLGGNMYVPDADPSGGTHSWTPSRVGVIFRVGIGGNTFSTGLIDWFRGI